MGGTLTRTQIAAGFDSGSKEDVETVRAFFQGLRARPWRTGCAISQRRFQRIPRPEFEARIAACYQAP
jgi:hypothetical protein